VAAAGSTIMSSVIRFWMQCRMAGRMPLVSRPVCQ